MLTPEKIITIAVWSAAVCFCALIVIGGHNTLGGRKPATAQSGIDILPDQTVTPGEINPAITQANIDQNICKKGWSTKSERPSSSYTTKLKNQQLADGYGGYTDHAAKDYEEDHLISLELGGNPTDPRNLWPEPYPSAHNKDAVENELHREVCAGEITLSEAQKEISTDWYSILVRMQAGVSDHTGTLGASAVSIPLSATDPDDED